MTLSPRILRNSIIRFIEILSWSEFQGSSGMLRGARLSPGALAGTLGSEEVSREHPWSGRPGWPAATGVYVELLRLSCCKNIPTSSRNNPHYLLAELCAKSLQACLALCDPMDCSPPGSSVHGTLQPRMLEWVAMPSSGDLPHPGIEPGSPSLQAHSLPSDPPVKPTAKNRRQRSDCRENGAPCSTRLATRLLL